MTMTAAEKLRTIMRRQGVTVTQLAEASGQTRQNLCNKFARDNLSERDMYTLAAALGCGVEITFTLPDGTAI